MRTQAQGQAAGQTRTAGTRAASAARPDPYQLVTDRMIAALENGTVPWHKPWSGGPGGRPRSMSTGRAYRGINTFLLGQAAAERGYSSPFWGTYRQISELGGQVRRGEQSTVVAFFKQYEVADKDALARGEHEPRTVPVLRHFRVFNAAQANGLPARFYPEPHPAHPDEEQLAGRAEAASVIGCYLADGGPQLRHVAGSNRACYRPGADVISLPPAAQFESAEAYYATMFHECGHSTGHASRLNRPGIAEFSHFGSQMYAKEELAAEMTAAMLCASTGIDGQFEASASYIADWLTALRDDKKLVISAASQAERAADLITEPSRQAMLRAEAQAQPRTEPEAG